MSEEKQQFNVYLPADLVKRVKYAALDYDKSLSGFVEDALELYLEVREGIEEGTETALATLQIHFGGKS